MKRWTLSFTLWIISGRPRIQATKIQTCKTIERATWKLYPCFVRAGPHTMRRNCWSSKPKTATFGAVWSISHCHLFLSPLLISLPSSNSKFDDDTMRWTMIDILLCGEFTRAEAPSFMASRNVSTIMWIKIKHHITRKKGVRKNHDFAKVTPSISWRS